MLDKFFTPNDINILNKKEKNLKVSNIVLCSFESPLARSGGLAAVNKKLLPALAHYQTIERVILLTPFYPHIIDEKILTNTDICFDVNHDSQSISVEILKSTNNPKNVVEYYLKAPGFFTAQNPINDPYGYFPNDPEKNKDAQIENSLFFCKAVPLAMQALKIKKDIVFHLKEWQTILITLTAKIAILQNILHSCRCVLTMHNPFDSWIPLEKLHKIIDDKNILEHPELNKYHGITAYQLGMQFLDTPITTVSEHFAEELTSDPLQTQHFAPHLQQILKKNRVVGVNNGMFIDFPPEYKTPAELSIDKIKEIKTKKRIELLEILDIYKPKKHFGELTYQGDSITKLPANIPILVMSGRLDPFQKGFDILLRALANFETDEIKAVISPMPINDSDLDFFHKIADQCKGNVTVLPIRMEKGYQELQMGSTFGMMPSIYEPFGAAVEFMVNGTVTIARETGGLVNQIQHKKCGFLFHEDPQTYTLENIQTFAQCNDAVQKRWKNPWVQSMVIELTNTIKTASDIYQNHTADYYQLILKGFKQARKFTWQKAVEKYYKTYRTRIDE